MSEWISHNGYGGCPISGAKAGRYEIRTRDGKTSFPKCEADRAIWTKHSDPAARFMDIVAYRDLRREP